MDIGDGALAELPPDWEQQVARAYSVFSTDPGAGEFAFNFTKGFLSEKAKGQVRNALGLFEKQAGGTDEKGRKLGRDGRPIRARLPASFARAPKVGGTISPVAMRQPPGGPPGRAGPGTDWLTEGQPLPEPAPQPKAGIRDRLKRAGRGLAEKGLEQALVPKDIRKADAEQRRLAADVIQGGPRTPGKDPSPDNYDEIRGAPGERRFRLRGNPKYQIVQDGDGRLHAFHNQAHIGTYDDARQAERDIYDWGRMAHPKQKPALEAIEKHLGERLTYMGEYSHPSDLPANPPYSKGLAFRDDSGAIHAWTGDQWMRYDADFFAREGVEDPDSIGTGEVGGPNNPGGGGQTVSRRDDLAREPDGPIKDILRWMFWPPEAPGRIYDQWGHLKPQRPRRSAGGSGTRRPHPEGEGGDEGESENGEGAEGQPTAPKDPMDGFRPVPEDTSRPRPTDGRLTLPKVNKSDDGYEIEESGTSVVDPPDKQPEYTARRPDGKEIGRYKTAKAARRAVDADRARAALEVAREKFIGDNDGSDDPMIQEVVDLLKRRHEVGYSEVGQMAGKWSEYMKDTANNSVLNQDATSQVMGLYREMLDNHRAGRKKLNPEKRTPESMPRRPQPGTPTPAAPSPTAPRREQIGDAGRAASPTPPTIPSSQAPAEPPEWAGNGPPPDDFDVDNIPGLPPAQTDEQRQARSTLRWQAQEWRNSLDQMERLPKALQSLEREKRQWSADNPAPSRQDFTGPAAADEHRAALATWKSDKKDMEEAAADRASRIRSSLQFNKERSAARSEDFAKGMDDIAGQHGYTGPKWWRGESAGPEPANVPEPGPTNAPEPSLPAPSGPEPAGGSRPYTLQRGESISLTPDANGLRSVTKDGRVIKRVRNDGTVIPVEPEPEVEAAPEHPPRVRRPPRRGGSA